MKPISVTLEHKQTAYIRLDTKKCKACWKCQEICSNNVIGRINLPWHKHSRIINGNDCSGCLKCMKVCAYNAINKVSINN